MTASFSPPDANATCVSLYADVEIAAAPDEVFRALTEPEELVRWWGGDDAYRSQEWEIDARPGGRWRARLTDARGNETALYGEIRVVDPPRVLEYTWHDSADSPPTVVRYDLTPATVRGVRGTRVTVTHSGIGGITACAGTMVDTVLPSLVWRYSLDRLARYAGTMIVLARAA